MRTQTLNHQTIENRHTYASTFSWGKVSVLLGRIFFALIFIAASFNHFKPETISYAAQQGVPLAALAVPVSGVMALVGGLSILFGFYARFGALLLILFLVPVTLMMHNFWAFADEMEAQNQMVHFMKNLSLLGSALLLFHFGSGPWSLKNK